MRPSPQVIPLPYYPDSAHWFALLAEKASPAWLDSGHPGSQYGRFDILAAEPSLQISTLGRQTRVWAADKTLELSEDHPLSVIRRWQRPPLRSVPDLPFIPGALGYFGYDLVRRLEQLPNQAKADITLPDLWLAFYDWAIIQDHHTEQAFLVTRPEVDLAPLRELLLSKDPTNNLKQFLDSNHNQLKVGNFSPDISRNTYLDRIAQIQRYIEAGDCYQVNFSQRFSARFEGNLALGFLALRQALPSPFSGYLPLPEGAVISLSPERFVALRDGRAETKPIKGTAPRRADPEADRAEGEALARSLKNRAENLMIVDLLRNDLSKSCDRVEVPQLFELQSFANVHHLVSTVTGDLRPGATALDLLEGSFPGGSITGAPKIRAMEVIEELEPSRRSVYCGSLGYLSADGNMDTNIAIRTLVGDGDRLYCWGGGGIVADSEPADEYEESWNKVRVLMDTLQSAFGVKSTADGNR